MNPSARLIAFSSDHAVVRFWKPLSKRSGLLIIRLSVEKPHMGPLTSTKLFIFGDFLWPKIKSLSQRALKSVHMQNPLC